MNIGRLDTLVRVYRRVNTQSDFGDRAVDNSSPLVVADAWVKEIPMKSNMVDQAGSIMINKNTFEFKARYNPNLWAAGRYFIISQDSRKYWIRGVQEIGRKEGMRIFADSEQSRDL